MQIRHIFQVFDKDDSGSVGYEEFLVGLRGQLNPSRMALVRVAFKRLDKDGNGYIDMNDIKLLYNARGHPDVIQKVRTEEEVLQEVLDAFDGGLGPSTIALDSNGRAVTTKGVFNKKGDGVVTLQEFCDYYANVSASIDDDDYFELMIRNAWHISGGKGWAANSSNARVLVTHADGTQTIEEGQGNQMSNDYSRSFGQDSLNVGANPRSRLVASLRGQVANNNPNSARSCTSDPVAGVAMSTLNERRGSRRNSGSSQHSQHSAPHHATVNRGASLAAGPNAGHVDVPEHRPGRQLSIPGTSHIRGLPDRASWTTTPGAAAASTGRVLKEIHQNQSPAPGSLAEALANKQPTVESYPPGRGAPPMAGRGVTPPTFSKSQLAEVAARNKNSAPKSLKEQLMGGY